MEIARIRGDLSMEDREGDAGVETEEETDEESSDEYWDSHGSETADDSSPEDPSNEVVCRVSSAFTFWIFVISPMCFSTSRFR